LLSFANVYFLESLLFNELQPIQTKKFPVSNLRLYPAPLERDRLRNVSSSPAEKDEASVQRAGICIARILLLPKRLSSLIALAVGRCALAVTVPGRRPQSKGRKRATFAAIFRTRVTY
jgi:hypothetical protein